MSINKCEHWQVLEIKGIYFEFCGKHRENCNCCADILQCEKKLCEQDNDNMESV